MSKESNAKYRLIAHTIVTNTMDWSRLTLSFECPSCHKALRVTFKRHDIKKDKEIKPLVVDIL